MSGKGPHNNKEEHSKYTKPLERAYDDDKAEERNTDHKFKKVYQTVGKPQTLDHNVMDDYVKKPPHNNPDLPPSDYVVEGAGDVSNEPNTVEAKSVAEIQARLDKIEGKK